MTTAAEGGRPTPDLLVAGDVDAAWTLALAHGAGAPMDSPFLDEFAAGMVAGGVRVVRFEFPYMAARRQGKRRPPDREPVLRATFAAVVGALAPRPPARLAIGGKSMGGRIASMVADELGANALLCLGYPFHPPKQPTKLRTAHLATLRTRGLIVQGERDAFGTRAEVAGYALSAALSLCWVPDGDHSFVPRRASGRSEADNLALAVAATLEFLRALD